MPYVGVEPGWSGLRTLFNGRNKNTTTLKENRFKGKPERIDFLEKKVILERIIKKKEFKFGKIGS